MSEMIIVEAMMGNLLSVYVEVLSETIGLGDNSGCCFGFFQAY